MGKSIKAMRRVTDSDHVEVFEFLHYDPRIDETIKPPSKRTEEDIIRIRGTLVEGTGEVVHRSKLDAHGRYYKPKST